MTFTKFSIVFSSIILSAFFSEVNVERCPVKNRKYTSFAASHGSLPLTTKKERNWNHC